MPIAAKRHLLKLAGHSGSIPPIIWRARSVDNGEPATISIHADGRIEYRFDQVVISNAHKGFKEQIIGGSPDDVHRILGGMLAKANRKGQSIYSQTGERISRLADFKKHFEVEETERFRARVEAFDFDIWVRGIFKIVLGLGHIILGPEWTFSTDGGDRSRSVLFSDREHWPAHSLRGFTVGELAPAVRQVLGLTPAVQSANYHTLAMFPQGTETLAAISLFGGDAVPECPNLNRIG
jgi:hypothetical protein